jgi:hypothetical protein
MLSLGDLPYGWSVDRDGSVPGTDPCSLSLSTEMAGTVQHDELYTASASGVPALGEVLISFPTVGAARRYFVANADSDGCFSFGTSLSGGTSTTTMSSMSDRPLYSFLSATDEGLASRLSETTTKATGQNTTVGIDRLFARRGRIVVLIYLAEPEDPETQSNLFAQFANRAVDKITDRETTAEYNKANELCDAALALTPGATSVSYSGVTTYGAVGVLGNPLSFNVPDNESTQAFLAACSYAGNGRPLIRVYVDAAGHRYEAPPLP